MSILKKCLPGPCQKMYLAVIKQKYERCDDDYCSDYLCTTISCLGEISIDKIDKIKKFETTFHGPKNIILNKYKMTNVDKIYGQNNYIEYIFVDKKINISISTSMLSYWKKKNEICLFEEGTFSYSNWKQWSYKTRNLKNDIIKKIEHRKQRKEFRKANFSPLVIKNIVELSGICKECIYYPEITCSKCKVLYCDDCLHFCSNSNCYERWCKDCSELVSCDKCNGDFCFNCINSFECMDACNDCI